MGILLLLLFKWQKSPLSALTLPGDKIVNLPLVLWTLGAKC